MNARVDDGKIELEIFRRLSALVESMQMVEQRLIKIESGQREQSRFLQINFKLGERIATDNDLQSQAKQERELLKNSAKKLFESRVR